MFISQKDKYALPFCSSSSSHWSASKNLTLTDCFLHQQHSSLKAPSLILTDITPCCRHYTPSLLFCIPLQKRYQTPGTHARKHDGQQKNKWCPLRASLNTHSITKGMRTALLTPASGWMVMEAIADLIWSQLGEAKVGGNENEINAILEMLKFYNHFCYDQAISKTVKVIRYFIKTDLIRGM